ncbi:DHGL-like protein [Mya arenaria]|uniref:DHGL-like protein n=1 Tax=Mya arenaria TaxID=6604 RepID=A0ABY7ELH3_MYAAR|nr:DHGL-like protein [Mya arenaria]
MSVQLGIIIIVCALLVNIFMEKKQHTQTDDVINDVYDYIVVGGGTAGSIIATRLSEDAATSVLLIEAGVFHPLGFQHNIPYIFDGGYYTVSQKHSHKGFNDQKSYWPRGRVLGGSGNINAMQYTRGSPWNYEEWKKAGCDGWGYRDVLPYFIKSEDMQLPEFVSSPFHGKGGPLAVSSGYQSEATQLFFHAGQELGYNRTDYNGYDQEGFGVLQTNIRNGVRSSASFEYLRKARYRPNLHVSLRSFVTKISIKANRAVGVYFVKDSRKHYVSTRKEIILSAGTINSPQLLMLSGIGPKTHLQELDIPVVADLPVGENLQDHLGLFMPSKTDKVETLNADLMQSKGHIYPDIQIINIFALLPNLFGFTEATAREIVPEPGNGFTIYILITKPLSRGSIKLRSKDAFDYPLIDPNYLSDTRDVKTLVGGVRIWEKILQTRPYQNMGLKEDEHKMSFCSQHEFRSNAYWECYIRHVAITTYHPTSTCKMDPENDPSTVVDTQLRVKGIKGLRVVDASIFPNITSGNTNIPTVMVAERAADFIRGVDSATYL